MVTIKQLEHTKSLTKSATPEQLKCSFLCFQGVKTLNYCLGNQSFFDNTSFVEPSGVPEDLSLLDALLLAQWEERMWRGCFRYDVTASEIKVISGGKKFLAQLNEKWIMDPFILNSIDQNEELLFCVTRSEKANSELIPSAAVPNDSILVIINANPIEYGHVFVVPCGSNRLYPDARSFEMIVRIAFEINNYSFRLFYDCSSPGASHVYFQKSAISGNLLAWECGGYFLFGSKYEFDQVTEEAIHKRLSAVSLNDEGFQVVKQLCCSIASKLAV
ncbi:GDP-L-galactose phosphorylase 1 isoform X2 [Citrus sinensis]|uniref:GDP-L-galactose phosphorylase 1 isoform X2 n=1 Tax=Citrus sinensis TaxID=2711 RepID=UPI000D625111|nr:GDP-L-galactose phosphorylase 1 isoform X2 [Citrus sinensis]